MSERLVALDKCPGVRPVGIVEVCRRLFSKLVLQAGGAQAKEACSSVNLCAGIKAGIEVSINAVRKREDMGIWYMVNERRERIESEEQT